MNALPRADKSLGQHFLKDQQIITKITHNYSKQADAILEIGPGPGILTKDLASHSLPFHVVEKDERFPELLHQFLPPEQVHLHDALTCDYEQFIDQHLGSKRKVWLVSNLPYNVGSLIFVKALACPSIRYMTLMFQREVADKIFAIDTRVGKAMNSLMALAQTYCEVKLLCKVPPGAFTPAPKVDSAVLSLARLDHPAIPLDDFHDYETFLRSLFRFKRKQMGKVLTMSYSKAMIEQVLDQLEMDKTTRAESLELQQVQQLYVTLKDVRGTS